MAVLVMAAGQATGTWAAEGYEKQPVLKASALAPAEWLKGARFQVEDKVPTEDFLGRFTIRSDVGAFEAHGLEMLKIRIAELAALEQLEVASKTETFLTALGSAAERPVKAVASFASRPVETVQGIPSGVERFFGRVKRGGESTITAVTAPGVSSTDKAEALSRRIGGITVDALGYEQERRQLAKQLQVDPYTTNPVLLQKLDEFAWVAFSGRVGVNAVISAVVPAPLDYVAWTARTAEFAKRSDLKAQERHVWLTGQVSPRAQKEMTKLGWGLHDGGRLRPSQPSGR